MDLETSGLLIDTGNLINCKEIKRKTSQSSSDELVESVSFTLKSSATSPNNKVSKNGRKILKSPYQTPIGEEERKDIKLTVKVFLVRFEGNLLREAIKEVMSKLEVNLVDSLILTLPSDQSVNETWKPLWKVLEEQVDQKKLVTIGVSDLDTQKLQELYQWAKVKPSVNQVNLESCCVMPPEMSAFAKENDIQLLTHSDPKELLSSETLTETLKPLSTTEVISWKLDWIARYSAIVKCRGIIQNRGYLLAASSNKD